MPLNDLQQALCVRLGLDPRTTPEDALQEKAADALSARAGVVQPRTVDRERRSIEIVLTTDAPVEVWDYERWEAVDEVLVMSGARLKGARKGKLPLLDCHQRDTARRVLGSVVDLRVDGGNMIGTEVYSAISEPEFIKAAEGHLDQRSVGYRVHAATWIAPGESAAVGGKTYTAGPGRYLKVATDWTPVECSVVPIAADPAAGTRSQAGTPPAKPPAQPPPAEPGNDSATQETRTMPENQTQNAAPPPVTPAAEPTITRKEFEALQKQVAESARAGAIDAVFRSFAHVDGIAAVRQAAIDDPACTVDAARAKLVELLASKTPSVGKATTGKEEADHRRENGIAYVYQRAQPTAKVTDEERKQAAVYRGFSLLDLARHCLEANGIATRGMDQMELVGRAFVATGDFPHILSSTANKALLAAYAAAPTQWARWCRRGSLSDFKATPRVQMSESGVLESVPEGAEFPQYSVSDTAENIQLGTYGKIFAITRQAIINDDMDAFGRIPTQHARAWARTINQLAVTHLLANPTMHDTGALYNATAVTTAGGHYNYDTSTTTVTTQATAEAVVRALFAFIRNQKDVDLKSYLQLMPAVVMTGPTLSRYFMQALFENNRSSAEAQVDIRRMGLDLIEEPEIENSLITGYANHSTYMFCNPSDAAAIEVAFLNGNDAPTLEQEQGFSIDGIRLKVRGDVGVKAIDWRPTSFHHN